MGEIHIRNVLTGASLGLTESPERYIFFMMREMYLAGGWTEVDKDSDTAWTDSSNIYLSLSDFAVSSASDQIVTSPTGGFDSAWEGKMLTLFASNDENRGIFNVAKVIDSNTLSVEYYTKNVSWTTESGISGRIHQATLASPFTTGAGYFVVQAPAASGSSLQLHYRHTSGQYIYVKAYPKGDYTTTAQATSEWTIDCYDDDYARFQAYFSDPAASEFLSMIFFYDSGAGIKVFEAGELFNVATGDNYPGYVQAIVSTDSLSNAIYMLDESGAATSFYRGYDTWHWGSGYSGAVMNQDTAKRMNGNRYKIFKPVVFGNTSQGGFIRGNSPRAFVNQYAPTYDEFGADYWRLGFHTLFPRNGVNDIRPILTTLS